MEAVGSVGEPLSSWQLGGRSDCVAEWIGMSFTLNADGTITTETGEVLGKKPDPAKPGESDPGKAPKKKLPRTGV